jgi:hypothetical protein
MDTSTSGSRTLASSYLIEKIDQSLTVATTEMYKGTAMDGDVWTPEDITITLTNGTTAQDQTITLDDWVPQSWDMPLDAEAMIKFAHEFIPGDGTVYNRAAIA